MAFLFGLSGILIFLFRWIIALFVVLKVSVPMIISGWSFIGVLPIAVLIYCGVNIIFYFLGMLFAIIAEGIK